jgi:hypothetical protein
MERVESLKFSMFLILAYMVREFSIIITTQTKQEEQSKSKRAAGSVFPDMDMLDKSGLTHPSGSKSV